MQSTKVPRQRSQGALDNLPFFSSEPLKFTIHYCQDYTIQCIMLLFLHARAIFSMLVFASIIGYLIHIIDRSINLLLCSKYTGVSPDSYASLPPSN